jgi:hypothetical protein
MALPMNSNFASCELSVEELERISAGNVGGAWNIIQTQSNSIVKFVSSTTGKTVVAYKGGVPSGGIHHYS